jgi:hypothetical protein
MYSAALVLHSWLRWIVLLAGLLAFVSAVAGVFRKTPWRRTDDRMGFWFILTLDIQILLGLLLYFALSPLTTGALRDFGAAMKDSALRFWAVEHVTGMVIAAALAHIGRARTRRVESLRRHKLAAVFFGLALAVVLLSIPWPGTSSARPLVRW